MKSTTARRTRVLGSGIPGESCAAAASFTETGCVTCHCHCPSSSRGAYEDFVASHVSTTPPSAHVVSACDLCGRFRDRADRDLLDALRTEDLATGHRYGWPRRKRCESHSPANRSKATDQKRDRTWKRDGVSLCESSARCASNVVRWIFTGRSFEGKRAKRRRSFSVIFLILAILGLTAAQNSTVDRPYNKDGVCQSVNIRNDVRNLSVLRGCRVVEGSVQIALIDRADQMSYANFSFPELVEITEYLLLFRLSGLSSIGQLFPNLMVIRGRSLFNDCCALVIYEMMQLSEIGLHSLTNILYGSVRIEKNPILCYVDTIDWDVIAPNGKGDHVILGNKPANGCPICNKSCPVRQTKPDETLCWNQHHCQKICKNCGNGACDAEGKCCHPFCLGGCTGPTARDCKVCKNVMVGGNECRDRCPNDTYEFMNRRCIKEQDCRDISKTFKYAPDGNPAQVYKPFNGSCTIECPLGYMDDEDTKSCKQCDGPCMKWCEPKFVDSISMARKLRGCTHINGSLHIQIYSEKNIVKELEENLSKIEEIRGFLKISRSFPLISLNFLKNLRRIRGEMLEYNKYSVAVFENPNLQELWDWNMHANITILSNGSTTVPGKIFFHFNPKLCMYKIETLRQRAKLEEFTDYDVARSSNGDKIACNITELRILSVKVESSGVAITWEKFKHHDTRSLLGYVIYIIEAPYQNVSIYDNRDACGGDGWRVEDVTQNHSEAHILTRLKPYTQYAFYIKTYTIATETSGAQSKLRYFTTKPDAPEPPRALSIYSNSSNELVITWVPPLKKNGNLTHYRIIGHWEPDDPNFIDQRNYCDEPLLLLEKKSVVITEEEMKHAEEEQLQLKTDEASCDCTARETDQSMREKEVSSSIAFENALHNHIYIKRQARRRREAINDMFNATESPKDDYNNSDQDRKIGNDKMENGTYVRFERLVPSTNLTYVMKNLRHFAAYNIEVQACRERYDNETGSKDCSMKSMKTYRTLAMESADNIPPNSFKLHMSGENHLTAITLYWDEPPQPNGLIVTYQIEYKRVDIENIKAMVVCITRLDFTSAGNLYVLKNLHAGNYSVKVRATSLAGNGEYTEVEYFYIKEPDTASTFWFWFSPFLLIVSVSVFFGAFICKRKLMRNVPNVRLIATVNPEYATTAYVPDEWEVSRKKIQLLRELGNGSFGMVYEGVAKDVVDGQPEVRCAVKTVNEDASDRQRIEFLNEASVMKAFNTYHVIKLLGVVSRGQPTLVVMELMVNGDLKTYLRSHRPDVCENFSRQPPTLKRILQMAIEIADGMAYLSAKKFVHRDLAARNCMVAEDLTVKIGDFGMTRDIYETDYYRKGTKGLLPVRWMAPESLKDGVFTSFSDVWSYGVVLWEMVTLASQPYQGLSNDQVLRYVIEGGVMERPENCPDSLYNLMRSIWNHKATRRPTFIDIVTMLLQEVDVEIFEKVSFYHSAEGIEARNQNSLHSPQNDNDLEMTALQDMREEEIEGGENLPLRQDFDTFASFEPTSIKSNLSPRYPVNSYGETSEAAVTTDFHDLNSSKVPLKAGFDDFDGVPGCSKDSLNLPFVEDSLKSVKSSPFIHRESTSHSNASHASPGTSASPQSLVQRNFLDSPNHLSKPSNNPDYENRSPEVMSDVENKALATLYVGFSPKDTMDININGDKSDGSSKTSVECVNKPETLNNGYIGTTT